MIQNKDSNIININNNNNKNNPSMEEIITILRFQAFIFFNARLSWYVKFDFRLLFCLAEDAFPSFV